MSIAGESARIGSKSGGVIPGVPDLFVAMEIFSAILIYSSSSEIIW
jgi:hypothetical protein